VAERATPDESARAALSSYSPLFTRIFVRYLRGYFAKRLHALRRLGPPPAVDPERPVVVYANHPGWWDPIVLLLLSQAYFGDRRNFGVIDADALESYAIFKRCGLFGVEETPRGAARFLRVSEHILAETGTSLWITPQGAFADVRAELDLRPGLARLAARAPEAQFLPLALEYGFWEESKPEAFFAFAPAVRAADIAGADDPTEAAAAPLAAAMARLSGAVAARDPSAFTTVIDGGAGVAWYYEVWRRAKALAGGRSYSAAHRDVKE